MYRSIISNLPLECHPKFSADIFKFQNQITLDISCELFVKLQADSSHEMRSIIFSETKKSLYFVVCCSHDWGFKGQVVSY